MKLLAFLIIALLAGCASMPKEADKPAAPIDLTKGKLAIATHADLMGAAAVAKKAADSAKDPFTQQALLARAAWWTAQDTMLTAREAQASVCLNAIRAGAPTLQEAPDGTGIFTRIELAAEAVGSFQGISPAVKLACEPLPIPALPVLPRP